MGEAMSAMQEKLDQDHSRVKTLWSNLTVGNHSRGEERPLTEPQHSTQLPGVVSRLTRLMDEYDSLVAELPHGELLTQLVVGTNFSFLRAIHNIINNIMYVFFCSV